jgi:hypothetical protein
MPFKTASQYVRDRLGIGLEVIDIRLDRALLEIKTDVEYVQILLKRLSDSKSHEERAQSQKDLEKNPFFSDCDPNFSLKNDTHIERFRYWDQQQKKPTAFETLRFKVLVLDTWWAANPHSPRDTPAQISITPNPVVAVDDKAMVFKKFALIDKHAHEWATIKSDFHSASENGLSKVAKAPGHGNWFEAAALNWADQRGKRTKEKQQALANAMINLVGKKHTLEG